MHSAVRAHPGADEEEDVWLVDDVSDEDGVLDDDDGSDVSLCDEVELLRDPEDDVRLVDDVSLVLEGWLVLPPWDVDEPLSVAWLPLLVCPPLVPVEPPLVPVELLVEPDDELLHATAPNAASATTPVMVAARRMADPPGGDAPYARQCRSWARGQSIATKRGGATEPRGPPKGAASRPCALGRQSTSSCQKPASTAA